MNISLGKILNNAVGYQELISLYHNAHSSGDQIIELDFSNTSWFDANICAPLGALLHRLRAEGKTIQIGNLNQGVKKILSKNAFLKDFGMTTEADVNRTTMQYSRFEPVQEKVFPSYVETHFKGKGIPKMSPLLAAKFKEGILELFSNAVLHSDTKHGIFVCGQYFPRSKRLDFSIVDMGVGIRHNVQTKKGLIMKAEDAIEWALTGNNTTKTGSIPGGLGLKLIRDFIQLNGGRIQIVSDAGYWETQKEKNTVLPFTAPFPGTLVNIEINTADKCSYQLASETAPATLI
jgi:hypothetical protein